MGYSIRQKNIIKELVHKEHATAEEIARELQISEKTVRKEIKEINRINGETVLFPVKGKGFRIDEKEINDALMGVDSYDRKKEFLKEILVKDKVDYYELADNYYISESTLESDIQELNAGILNRYQTSIVRKKNCLYLDCQKQVRRQIHTNLLMKEVETHEFNLDSYENCFIYSTPEELKKLLLDFSRKNGLDFNDVELLTFLIHIGILIDSVKSGNSGEEFLITGNNRNVPHAEELCKCIEERYSLLLNEVEQSYVASLLSARSGGQFAEEERTVKIQKFIKHILNEVETSYNIVLKQDSGFENNLLMHLLALLGREQHGRQWENPLIMEIREKFPFLYDISVFIMVEFQKQFQVNIQEDEIGFITLHLMCLAEKMNRECWRIAVIDPVSGRNVSYYQTRLEFCFPNELIEVECFSLFELEIIRDFLPSFIIMTAGLQEKFDVPSLLCSPLLMETDIKKIERCMKELKNERTKNQMLRLQFDERLFFYEPDVRGKKELIHLMCGKLTKYGYCDENYEELILERERIAPTSFGNLFAIPHPVKKEALRSGVAIAVLKKTMDWSGQKVRLVFMFSLSKDNEDMMKLYGSIVERLDDKDRIKRLLQKQNYEEFVEEFIKG